MRIDELKQLLPFYVNGTLDHGERIEVEEALKISEELRKELDSGNGQRRSRGPSSSVPPAT